ncbi:MAG TPA: hypothetical protein VGA49_01845 [Patescibacteria group bacterium]
MAKRKTGAYPHLGEVWTAVDRLGIKTSGEYHRRYQEDPRLYSDPGRHYPDWQGWSAFFGRNNRHGKRRKKTE